MVKLNIEKGEYLFKLDDILRKKKISIIFNSFLFILYLLTT